MKRRGKKRERERERERGGGGGGRGGGGGGIYNLWKRSNTYTSYNVQSVMHIQDICLRQEGCQPVIPVVEFIHSFVSYIGTIISIIGLILTIITMLVFK